MQMVRVRYRQLTGRHCVTTSLNLLLGRSTTHTSPSLDRQAESLNAVDITSLPLSLYCCSLCRAPRIVQVQLGECMKTIVLVDFPDKWPSLLPQLSQNLRSQVQCIHSDVVCAQCSACDPTKTGLATGSNCFAVISMTRLYIAIEIMQGAPQALS